MEVQKQLRVETSGIFTYVCKSAIGASTSQAAWSIVRYDSDGNSNFPVDSNGLPSSDEIFVQDDFATITYFDPSA